MSNDKKTFWPWGILLSIIAIIIACVATIIFSLDYPVYEDDTFMQKYQSVDRNINEIKRQQDEFEKNFVLQADLKPYYDEIDRIFYILDDKTKEINIFLSQLNQLNAKDIHFEALLTRPHTTEQDSSLELSSLSEVDNTQSLNISLEPNALKNYSFKILLPKLEKGRWQVKLKAEKNEIQRAFYTYSLTLP